MSVTSVTTQSTFSLHNAVLLTAKGELIPDGILIIIKYKPAEPSLMPHHH